MGKKVKELKRLFSIMNGTSLKFKQNTIGSVLKEFNDYMEPIYLDGFYSISSEKYKKLFKKYFGNEISEDYYTINVIIGSDTGDISLPAISPSNSNVQLDPFVQDQIYTANNERNVDNIFSDFISASINLLVYSDIELAFASFGGSTSKDFPDVLKADVKDLFIKQNENDVISSDDLESYFDSIDPVLDTNALISLLEAKGIDTEKDVRDFPVNLFGGIYIYADTSNNLYGRFFGRNIMFSETITDYKLSTVISDMTVSFSDLVFYNYYLNKIYHNGNEYTITLDDIKTFIVNEGGEK